MLELLNKVCINSTFDYADDLRLLNLENRKKNVVFHIKVANRRFVMKGMQWCFKKDNFFIGLKYNKFAEMLEFCKQNKIICIKIIVSKVRCTNKWFNHWEFNSLRFYPYCYGNVPSALGYYCYISEDVNIKRINE